MMLAIRKFELSLGEGDAQFREDRKRKLGYEVNSAEVERSRDFQSLDGVETFTHPISLEVYRLNRAIQKIDRYLNL